MKGTCRCFLQCEAGRKHELELAAQRLQVASRQAALPALRYQASGDGALSDCCSAYIGEDRRAGSRHPELMVYIERNALSGPGRQSLSMSRVAVPNLNECIRVGTDRQLYCSGRPEC